MRELVCYSYLSLAYHSKESIGACTRKQERNARVFLISGTFLALSKKVIGKIYRLFENLREDITKEDKKPRSTVSYICVSPVSLVQKP